MPWAQRTLSLRVKGPSPVWPCQALNKDLAELNKQNLKAKDQVRDTTMVLPKDTELEEVKPEETPEEAEPVDNNNNDEPEL